MRSTLPFALPAALLAAIALAGCTAGGAGAGSATSTVTAAASSATVSPAEWIVGSWTCTVDGVDATASPIDVVFDVTADTVTLTAEQGGSTLSEFTASYAIAGDTLTGTAVSDQDGPITGETGTITGIPSTLPADDEPVTVVATSSAGGGQSATFEVSREGDDTAFISTAADDANGNRLRCARG